MWTRAALLTLATSGAAAQEPLSAIDWLSEEVARPPAEAAPSPEPAPHPDAAPSAERERERVEVAPLDAPTPSSVGVLSQRESGLGHDLWSGAGTEDLAAAIRDAPIDALPAAHALLYRLLLAEALPPPGDRGAFLLARIDKLLALGALDRAAALIDSAGVDRQALRARRFDIALLQGETERACAALGGESRLGGSYAARIFCMARRGDRQAARVTFRTGRALGEIDAQEADLLARFLDIGGGAEAAPPADAVTPLVFRLRRAAGLPMPTAGLPRAFAHADLRAGAGRRDRIEAAERLARTDAISPERLHEVYLAGSPAASGGLWDRVASVRALDRAVEAEDAAAVARALPGAWKAMRRADLGVPFARLYAGDLAANASRASISDRALRIRLLAPGIDPETAGPPPADQTGHFLWAIATDAPATGAAKGAVAKAVRRGLTGSPLAPEARDRLRTEPGAAILEAHAMLVRGAEGEMRDLSAALAMLRAAGLPDIARRAALELLILGPGR